MRNFQLPDTLRQHRPLLLALEAIGWLHMTGKAKADFLQAHGGQGNYDYTKWHERENPPFPWDDLLKWAKDSFDLEKKFSLSDDPWPGTFTAFLTKHTGRDSGILGLLQAGHAITSGIEKNLPKNTSKYLGQDATHMWLSTAFGHPVRNLLANPPELLTETGWRRLLEQIEKLLTELKRLGKRGFSNDLNGWCQWRESAVGINGWLRKAFTATLAETRLPNNDVTLFDQSYVAAALFKSAAAGAILEGHSFPWKDSSLKQQSRWRLLTVGIGVDHYEARAVKIGDWTGTRLVLDKFFWKARKLIEVDLAVGSLLYADGEVCVFSFPGERFNQNGSDLQIEKWNKWLTDQIDSYAREAKLELPPYCSISEPSRSLVGMTAEIHKARETMAVPLHGSWEITGGNSDEGHVCPVCLVRRSGDKSSKQTPCKICRDRRTGRLDAWLSGTLCSDTIWITEVADSNDRVAFITMSLDIEHWLDGTRVDSLRTQALPQWNRYNKKIAKAIKNQTKRHATCPLHVQLLEYYKKRIKNPTQDMSSDGIISKMIPGIEDEFSTTSPASWKNIYLKMVEDRANAPKWDNLDDSGRARWLIHQLFRKLASPGRVYRFQRQAEDFFKALLADFREIAAADQNRWRTRRLILEPGNGSAGLWEDRQTYNGRYEDAPISLLYREETKDFLTICNLARLLKPEQGKDSLNGITLELKGEDREHGKKVRTLQVKSVSDNAGELGCYHPVIPLELSPVRFRILVPLEAASKCVDYAIEAWSNQIARVWDRLPLLVGVVAFPKMTPFQAVIEAARNIEADLAKNGNKPETWRVAGCETRDSVTALSFRSLDDQSEILQTMPIRLPDDREDVFYPYLAVEDMHVRFPRDFRHPDGQVYRHVKDLRIGDGVRVCPSLIASVFMDSTAKRFEHSNRRQLTQWLRMRDLWKLIGSTAPSQTALRGAWSELVERRETWLGPDGSWLEGGKEAWLDLVRAVFHERLNARGACLETLVDAACEGLLEWSLEWHINVLKKGVLGG